MTGCYCQAEDGIRDGHVTGVQTCALPIWSFIRIGGNKSNGLGIFKVLELREANFDFSTKRDWLAYIRQDYDLENIKNREIGRASCRERIEVTEVNGVGRKKVDRRKSNRR